MTINIVGGPLDGEKRHWCALAGSRCVLRLLPDLRRADLPASMEIRDAWYRIAEKPDASGEYEAVWEGEA